MDSSPARGAEAAAGAGGPDVGSAEEHPEAELLRGYDILRLRAPNPGPLTLSGTNAWLVGRNPTWVVDPGPLIDTHLERLFAAITDRGGLGGVVLTHDHHDHAESVDALRARHPAPLAAARGAVEVTLSEGEHFGPFEAVSTPGHAVDHFALVAAGACFTGDAVLGEGSVFINPYSGALAGYLDALGRLRIRQDFNVICPGHGPPVWDTHAKLEEYVEHRVERERSLIAALAQGRRTIRELLDAAWSDVPERLRPLATITLSAHLDKLKDEGMLPEDVEQPKFERAEW
ncbi:MAG: MBL fold metallo-hydrolase [Solirubrobacteraceae bacterium]|jgi:glyoxylase-like metal-dependent hydrolase (beta-lactamase superfamily II)